MARTDSPRVAIIGAGTIAVWSKPALLGTFRYDCEYQPPFMAIYQRQLREWGFAEG
jgi:hypothetical protein